MALKARKGPSVSAKPTDGARPRPVAKAPGKGERVSAVDSSPVTKAPAFTIHNPVDTVEERFLKVLVYGDFGVGKTYLSASAVDVDSMRDVLFIDAEAGEMSLTGVDGVDVITIGTYKQLARIYEFLRLNLRLVREGKDDEALAHQQRFFEDQRVKEPNRLRKYRTVVIDSLSEVQKYLMYQLLDIQLGVTALDVEPEVAAQRDWLASADMIRLLIRYMRDLPVHVVIVCSEDWDEDTNKMVPKLPGKLAKEIPGFMDIVGYLSKTKTKDEGWVRRLYLASGYPRWKSKHRFRNLPDLEYLDNPSLAGLVRLDREDASLNGNPSRSSSRASNRQPTAASQRSRQARTQ